VSEKLSGVQKTCAAFFTTLNHHRHEGSIPFTRSIDNQRLTRRCSKSAVSSPAKLLTIATHRFRFISGDDAFILGS
jgi:hypothetical protein